MMSVSFCCHFTSSTRNVKYLGHKVKEEPELVCLHSSREQECVLNQAQLWASCLYLGASPGVSPILELTVMAAQGPGGTRVAFCQREAIGWPQVPLMLLGVGR